MPAGKDPAPAGRISWVAVGAAVLVSLGASLPVYVVSTASVEIRRSLQFGPSALGVALSAYFVGAAVSALPLSRLVERVGGARTMRIAAVGDAAVLAAMAVGARSWWSLAVLLALAGVVAGGVMPAVYLFLSRRIAAPSQGRAFGINQAATPLAPLLGGLAVPAVALTVGWRWALVVAAAVSVAAALAVPRPWTTLAQRQQSRFEGASTAVVVMPLAVLSVGMGLGMFAASGLVTFLPTGALALGFSRASAGLLVGGASSAAVGVRVAIGIRADRRGDRHLRVVAVMMAVGALGYVLVAVSAASDSRWLLAVASVVAVGVGWGWNGLFMFAVARSHGHAPAKATGIIDVGGRIGGILGPLVIGVLIGHVSFESAWLATAGAAAGAAGVVLFGRRLLVATL